MPPKKSPKVIKVNKNQQRLTLNGKTITKSNSKQIVYARNANYRHLPTRSQIYKFKTTDYFTEQDIKQLTSQLYSSENWFNNPDYKTTIDLEFFNNGKFKINNFYVKNTGSKTYFPKAILTASKCGYDEEENINDIELNTFYLTINSFSSSGYGKDDDDGWCFWKCIRPYLDPKWSGNYKNLVKKLNAHIEKHKLIEKKAINELLDEKRGNVKLLQLNFISTMLNIKFIVNFGKINSFTTNAKEEYKQTLYLTLENEHYEIDTSKINAKTDNEQFRIQKIARNCICAYYDETIKDLDVKSRVYLTYNFKTNIYDTIENPEYNIYKENHVYNIEEIKRIYGTTYKKEKLDNENLTVEQFYSNCFQRFINDVNELKEDNYDLTKYRSIAFFIKDYIYNLLNKKLYNDYQTYSEVVENIAKYEYNWIKLVSGQLQKPDKQIPDEQFTKMFHYDQTSSYPYMLKRHKDEIKYDNQNFLFNYEDFNEIFNNSDRKTTLNLGLLYIPFTSANEDETFERYKNEITREYWVADIKKHKLRYGLYNIKINIPEDNKYYKFFKFNEHNIYTHYDLYVAYAMRPQEDTFEIIKKKRLYWRTQRGYTETKEGKKIFKETQCWKTSDIFSTYINTTFEKRNKYPQNKLIKQFISRIHGVLCEINKFNYKDDLHINTISDEVDEIAFENKDFQLYYNEFYCSKEENGKYGFIKEGFYKSPLARIKPFIYAYQRYFFFFCVFKPLVDGGCHIYRIYTDGFYCDKRIDKFYQYSLTYKDTKKKILGQILEDPLIEHPDFKFETFNDIHYGIKF